MQGLPRRYEPIAQDKKGGMGDVIFCRDTTLERTVAIKIIRTITDQRRILDELTALMLVRSKHVVQVYDIVRSEHFGIGIVQEFIDGKDLIEGFTPPHTNLEYYKNIWQIAAGISEIHNVGIIHRDIKPNNMKLDPEGIIKIYDFGLARSEVNAETVGFIGTQGFSAPELFAENPIFSNAIDVYSFGATALFLAAGDLPNDLKYSNGKPVAASHFNLISLALDNEVLDILNRCLKHSPSERPTMVSVRDTLAKYISFNQHQALVVHKGAATYLNLENKTIALEFRGVGRIDIQYNGCAFVATETTGEVFINNRPVSPGEELPGSCVVALGAAYRKAEREFITFDISYPEVYL